MLRARAGGRGRKYAGRSAAGRDGRTAVLLFVTGEIGIEAHVAQLAEHVLGKDEVSGSIPLMGSRAQVVEYKKVQR